MSDDDDVLAREEEVLARALDAIADVNVGERGLQRTTAGLLLVIARRLDRIEQEIAHRGASS